MAFHNNPRIVTDGLVLCLDAADNKSYPARNFVSAKVYSVYSGGARSANYTVQYSDDNSSWTTAFSGVCSNEYTSSYSNCGIKNNTGLGDGSYGNRKYWRYVEGSAIISHHPRISRIILTDINGVDYAFKVYVADNCSDSGTYIVGTVSVDVGGTTWYDRSGNGDNITFANAIPYDGGFNFTTTSHYAPAPTAVESLKGDITMEVWCKQASRGGPHQTIICTDSSYRRGMKLMSAYHSYGGAFWVADGSGSTGDNLLDTAGGTLENTGVFHLVATRKTSTGAIKIYLNGELSASTTHIIGDVSTATNNGYIGREYHSGGSYGLKADVYSIRVYNKDLSATEVFQNFDVHRTRFGI